MIKFYKINSILFLVVFFISFTYSQNEFYNNGGIVYLNSGSADITPTLFINGNITNEDGMFINDSSFLETKGDFTNNPFIYSYTSRNGAIERFSGDNEQAIKGYWSQGYGFDNQFYNLKIYKTNSTGNNKYLTLHTDVNVNTKGSIEFETPSSNVAIIRTDNAATSPSNPALYQFTLNLQNPSPSSISGYSSMTANETAPVTSKYIEGKFKRMVNRINVDYDFPIGLRPNLKDGMEPFSLNFSKITDGNSLPILGFIRDAIVNPLYRDVLADVGTDPGLGNQQIPDCTGGKDGIYDWYYIDNDLTHEWSVTPDNVYELNENHVYTYVVTLHPGPILDNLTYYNIPASCDASYNGQRIRVVAKDGIVGGTSQIGPGNYAPFAHLTSYVWDVFDDQSLPIALSNQETFSTYRIHGTSNFNLTALPVELVNFQLEPINNEYFNLFWKTASELNNSGFFVERSEDGKTFRNIGWVAGNGTTSSIHDYNFEDHTVEPNIIYYYRLKQVDFNQLFKNTYIISGRLGEMYNFNILNIASNPTKNNTQVSISIPDKGILKINIYDILGQNIKNNAIELSKGINNINIDISDLAASSYIVTFNYNDKIISKKIIKK